MKTINRVQINLNEHVQFAPTERDLQNWKAHYDKYRDLPLSYYQSKVDKDGLVTMQIHEYISVFSEHIGIGYCLPGMGQLIFDTKELVPYPTVKANSHIYDLSDMD